MSLFDVPGGQLLASSSAPLSQDGIVNRVRFPLVVVPLSEAAGWHAWDAMRDACLWDTRSA